MPDAMRPVYVPPTDDEPLDAVQLALKRMWVGIIGRRIRAKLAAERAAAEGARASETPPADGARADAC